MGVAFFITLYSFGLLVYLWFNSQVLGFAAHSYGRSVCIASLDVQYISLLTVDLSM